MHQSSAERASTIAFKRLEALGNDVTLLSVPFQTIVAVTTAQGIIDNGGLEYFFGADFPNHPPYSFFVEAYR